MSIFLTATTLKPSSTTQAPVLPSRRPFRVASRRRLISSSTSTTTAKTTAALIESEEYLQDIGDTGITYSRLLTFKSKTYLVFVLFFCEPPRELHVSIFFYKSFYFYE